MELVGYEDDEARSYEVFSFVTVHDFRFMKLQCRNASAHSDRALHEVDEIKLLYQSITNVGVDVDYNRYSWAVICIDGRPEYVKFVDLTGAEEQYIKCFINRFN